MKLQDAKVCAECDEVVSAETYACPSCTSHQFWFPSRTVVPILSRDEIDRARTEAQGTKADGMIRRLSHAI